MINNTTNVVCRHKFIQYEIKDNDNRCITCTGHINKNDIILMEHCFVAPFDDKTNKTTHMVAWNIELFDSLFPRKEKWKEEFILNENENKISQHINDLIHEKITCNAFGYETNELKIGNKASWINHNDNPNAFCYEERVDKQLPIPIVCICLIALEDIKCGEEITISYGNYAFDDFGKVIKKEDDGKYKKNYPTKQTKDAIHCFFDNYLLTEEFKDLAVKHMCIDNGLNYVNDIIGCSKRFVEFITTKYGIFTIENTMLFFQECHKIVFSKMKEWNIMHEEQMKRIQNKQQVF